MKTKKTKCYIYTRVSTAMQVYGYSLDVQKEKLKRYADYEKMKIVVEYSDGSLAIAEDEADMIRLIFDKYIHTDMGANGVAEYLNNHGYKKKQRQNNTLTTFAPSFIKGVLDNPVYMGKLAYGRRATEKIQ